jgi:hypothetical protein
MKHTPFFSLLTALLLAPLALLLAAETPIRDQRAKEQKISPANLATLNLSQLFEPGSKNGSASEIQDGAAILVGKPFVFSRVPAELKGAPFLKAWFYLGVVAECTKAGTVFAITPSPESKAVESNAKFLESQGFSRAALSSSPVAIVDGKKEVELALYQKQVSPGDQILTHRWAVLIGGFGRVDPKMKLKYRAKNTSPVTNNPKLESDGRPTSSPAAPLTKLKPEATLLYEPTKEYTYSHHSAVTVFKSRLYAMWSNGYEAEDSPGQRVLISDSPDGITWSPPRVLAAPAILRPNAPKELREGVLVAAGFHEYDGHLIAFYNDLSARTVKAVKSSDGKNWSSIIDLGISVWANKGPKKLTSGRLLLCGQSSVFYTDDPSGLSGWARSGPMPSDWKVYDGYGEAQFLAGRQGWQTFITENDFYQTDDGVIRLFFRAGVGGRGTLWMCESKDNGAAWSAPAETAFTDMGSRFDFGRLPDGRFYYLGNAFAGAALRSPRVL